MSTMVRRFIIKKANDRVLNEDQTANLAYPTWKRKTLAVGSFFALRVVDVLDWVFLSVIIVTYPLIKMFEAIVEIFSSVAPAARRTRDVTVGDYNACRRLYNGHHGVRNIKVGKPNAAPTPF